MVWWQLLITSLLSGIAQLCQKQAALSINRRWFYIWMLIALGLLSLAMLCWLRVLQILPVGIAYPLLSLNYLWVALMSYLLWRGREPIVKQQWLGILFIIIGTFLLGTSY
ncbi:4-amino-4-deoxy-L-arabinose-phosphoundecaprenol flippase subunit ArnE [Rosenbergiella collisarenosi]|uniref:4-amino-4-deoxy-L-arabinose-phosphoundecaprenol flippase subunit ArnE n=1 Tax=Rosenbergiella collisarenosi TaxID=1544695 RepID=UPI0030C7FD98